MAREEGARLRWKGASRTHAHPTPPSLVWKLLAGSMKLQQQWPREALCCALAGWTAAGKSESAHPVAAAAQMDCSCAVLVELNAVTSLPTRLHPMSTLRSEAPDVGWWGSLARVAPPQ